jgi:hypothetical protein
LLTRRQRQMCIRDRIYTLENKKYRGFNIFIKKHKNCYYIATEEDVIQLDGEKPIKEQYKEKYDKESMIRIVNKIHKKYNIGIISYSDIYNNSYTLMDIRQ